MHTTWNGLQEIATDKKARCEFAEGLCFNEKAGAEERRHRLPQEMFLVIPQITQHGSSRAATTP